ncbi:MAG: hypothetical protein HY875_15675 [Chloroflexi bacterium]|nr:hypothetical protein [Chloroflexota bacterium]
MGDFENALATTETDSRASLKAAESAVQALRKLVAATRAGDISALERGLDDADAKVQALREQLRNTREGWSFETQTYSDVGMLTEELVACAREAGLPVYEQDGRIFSYPVLVRVIPGDRALLIDKERVRGIRPSAVVERLKRLAQKPPRFKPEAFLEALFEAYQLRLRIEGGATMQLDGNGPQIQLIRLHELLTLFPGHDKEYTRADFARDIYLLDRSGAKLTKGGRAEMSLPQAATATKTSTKTVLTIVDQAGKQREYGSISFRRLP